MPNVHGCNVRAAFQSKSYDCNCVATSTAGEAYRCCFWSSVFYLCIYVFIHSFIHSLIHWFLYLSIYLLIYLSIDLSVCLSIYLSVCTMFVTVLLEARSFVWSHSEHGYKRHGFFFHEENGTTIWAMKVSARILGSCPLRSPGGSTLQWVWIAGEFCCASPNFLHFCRWIRYNTDCHSHEQKLYCWTTGFYYSRLSLIS